MRTKILLPFIFYCLIILYSCKRSNNTTKEVKLKKDTTITQLSDTSFISDVRSLYFDKYLYLTDYSRDQIIILNRNGKFIKTLNSLKSTKL